MPNNKKYYFISVGLAIAIHISLALLINQSLSFAHNLPNKLSLKLMSSYEQLSQPSLESNQETIVQEPDNSFNNIQEQKPTKISKPDIIEPKATINKPEKQNISKSKPVNPANPQEPQKKQTDLQAPQNLQVPVNSQNLQNSQSLQSSQGIDKIHQAQNSGSRISRPAKIDFQRGVYPQGAKLRGEEGICVLLLTISPEAHIIKAELITSSTYPRLDEAALKYALDPKAKHKIEVALANGQAIEATILVNVHFRLTSS